MDELTRLRDLGWMVAIHNDYRQGGRLRTFWLLTHPDGRWIKGEGDSDGDAIAECVADLKVKNAAQDIARRNVARRKSEGP